MEAPQVDPSQASVAIAALCGGVVRLLWRPVTTGSLSVRLLNSVWLLGASAICGFYATPVAVRWLNLNPDDSLFVAAVLGLIGLSLAGGLLRAADGFEVKSWLKGMIERDMR